MQAPLTQGTSPPRGVNGLDAQIRPMTHFLASTRRWHRVNRDGSCQLFSLLPAVGEWRSILGVWWAPSHTRWERSHTRWERSYARWERSYARRGRSAWSTATPTNIRTVPLFTVLGVAEQLSLRLRAVIRDGYVIEVHHHTTAGPHRGIVKFCGSPVRA